MVAMLFETLFNELEGMENRTLASRNRGRNQYSNHQHLHPLRYRNHPYAGFLPFGIAMKESDHSDEENEDSDTFTNAIEGYRKYYPTKSPAVDFIETEKNYNIAVELPGVSKEAIDIKLENGILTVSTGTSVETKIANEPNKNTIKANSAKKLTDSENDGKDDFEMNTGNSERTKGNEENNTDGDVSVESIVDEEDAFSGEDVAAEKLAMTLSENKKRQNQNQMDTDSDERGNANANNDYVYKYIERSITKYERKFKLDKRVTPESITASFENGVLQLTIAKPVKKSPERIAIM